MIFFIANQFNNIFTSIASKLVENIPTSKKPFDIFLGRKNQNTFFMSPTSTEEVEDIISSFYLNKALEPNSVPMKILKDLKEELSKTLTVLTNLTFSLGIFPNCLKIAKVMPVFKRGDQQECNNYTNFLLLQY